MRNHHPESTDILVVRNAGATPVVGNTTGTPTGRSCPSPRGTPSCGQTSSPTRVGTPCSPT
ncbi:hypothetical protein HFP72_01375 [Nocardiopsis sp. ARC36]